MHDSVRAWVRDHASDGHGLTILEFGSRDMNGSVRDCWPLASWVGVDIGEGPGVDIVADGCTYVHPSAVDVVVCCEVLEHLRTWDLLVANAAANLAPGGLFVGTCAGPGRNPHSGRRPEPELDPDEHYANVGLDEFRSVAARFFASVEARLSGTDLQWCCVK